MSEKNTGRPLSKHQKLVNTVNNTLCCKELKEAGTCNTCSMTYNEDSFKVMQNKHKRLARKKEISLERKEERRIKNIEYIKSHQCCLSQENIKSYHCYCMYSCESCKYDTQCNKCGSLHNVDTLRSLTEKTKAFKLNNQV